MKVWGSTYIGDYGLGLLAGSPVGLGVLAGSLV